MGMCSFHAVLAASLMVAMDAVNGTCDMAEDDRVDCGYAGIEQKGCESKGCCWKPVNPNPSNTPWCFQKGGPSPPSPSPSDNPNYKVSVDSSSITPLENRCQGQGCGQRSNNLASHTMSEDSGRGYKPVRVVVTSLKWNQALGEGWSVRPSHLQAEGIISNIDSSEIHTGKLSFIVKRPCQVSVELGDEAKLFSSQDSYRNFANLILSFNPPESFWPHRKPKLVDGSSCNSSESGRSCVLGHSGSSCSDVIVSENQDMYFAGKGTSYTWGQGCGDNPKKIMVRAGGRVFLDDDVLLNARVLSDGDVVAGLYGYGFVNNQFMKGEKRPDVASNVVSLTGSGSEVFGVTVLDSTYRNIQVGGNSTVSWTKSFAWNSETDCVNVKAPGSSISNNFFKTNDDCLKGYQHDTLFSDNVIWHQTVGRVLMLSWGNLNEARNLDSTTHYLRTSVIHDELAFSSASPRPGLPEAFGYQVSMIYYSALINAQHSPNNVIGTVASPVLIEDLYIESQVGSVMLLTNGYAGLDNKATWMGKDGCTGNINMKIKNLDMSHVTRVAAKSVVGGCNVDQSYLDVANAQCICKSPMGCSGEHCCGVSVSFEGVVDPATGPKFTDSFLVGDNARVTGLPAASMNVVSI